MFFVILAFGRHPLPRLFRSPPRSRSASSFGWVKPREFYQQTQLALCLPLYSIINRFLCQLENLPNVIAPFCAPLTKKHFGDSVVLFWSEYMRSLYKNSHPEGWLTLCLIVLKGSPLGRAPAAAGERGAWIALSVASRRHLPHRGGFLFGSKRSKKPATPKDG